MVNGAFVTALLPDGSRRTAVTDVNGRYEFADVPIGRMTVEVLSNGLTRKWTAEVLETTARVDVPFAVEQLTLALTGRRARPETALALLLLGLGSALLVVGRRGQRVGAAR